MGFQLPQEEGLLKFNGTKYEGAEITVSLTVSLETYFQFDRLVKSVGTAETGPDEELVRAMCDFFIEHCLIRWNLEDDNGPLPMTIETLLSQPPQFTNLLFTSWLTVAVNPDPLVQPDLATVLEEELELGNMSRPN